MEGNQRQSAFKSWKASKGGSFPLGAGDRQGEVEVTIEGTATESDTCQGLQ